MAPIRQNTTNFANNIAKNCIESSNIFVNELNDEVDSHVNWLRDVVAKAKSLNSDEPSCNKRKGDILPKTPKKRKYQTKKNDCVAEKDDNSTKDSSAKPLLKECYVKLDIMQDTPFEEIDGEAVKSAVTSHRKINTNVAEILNTPLLITPVKPVKPPRKTKYQENKENNTPAKKIVPEGTVATQIKLYEEKIGQTPQKSISLNQTLTDTTNSTRLKLPLKQNDEAAAVEAKATEIMISHMSYSQRRSSRVRCKSRAAKNILNHYSISSGDKKIKSFRESLAACLSTASSPSFVTATNSPNENNNSEVGEIINETQEDNILSSTFTAKPLANSTHILSSDMQHSEFSPMENDNNSTKPVSNNFKLETYKVNSAPVNATPVILQPKVKIYSLESSSKVTRDLNKSLIAKKFKNKTSSALRNPVTVKINSGITKLSIFGMKRYVSMSPTGSSYRFGSTPDKMMTPVNDNKWHEKHLELNARAESVVKKREMYLKKIVEEKKRKREEKTKKVTLERQKKEEERLAKLKKGKEIEKQKKYLQKMKLEEEKKIKEADQLREKLRIEEKKRKEQELIDKEIQKQAAKIKIPEGEHLNTNKNMFLQPATSASNLNATYNAGEAMNSTYNADNYQITPKNRPQCLTNPENYDIDNLREEDSTDDEEKPKKPIPAWASGNNLKESIMQQLIFKPDYEMIFPSAIMFGKVNLNEIFKTRRKRFNCRTSSAIWVRPMLPKTPTS